MTTEAITKAHATTAACKAWSRSNTDNQLVLKVCDELATNAAELSTESVTPTAIMKAHELQLHTKLHTKLGLPINCQDVSQMSPDALQPQTFWHQETTAPGFIIANMTTKAITMPHATTAA